MDAPQFEQPIADGFRPGWRRKPRRGRGGDAEALLAWDEAPAFVVGTSAGAINAAYFAGDPTCDGVERLRAPLVLGPSARDLADRTTKHRHGTFRAPRISGRIPWPAILLERHLQYAQLESAAIPVHIVASDIISGREVVLSSGSVVDAVLASTAIPGVFPPVKIGPHMLVDGGVANNAPISVAVALGAKRVVVLPTGFTCAPRQAPQGAIGRAMHAVRRSLRGSSHAMPSTGWQATSNCASFRVFARSLLRRTTIRTAEQLIVARKMSHRPGWRTAAWKPQRFLGSFTITATSHRDIQTPSCKPPGTGYASPQGKGWRDCSATPSYCDGRFVLVLDVITRVSACVLTMRTRELRDTVAEVTRIAGGTELPVLESVLHGHSRVTAAWTHAAYETEAQPMQHHVIVATHAGSGLATAEIDGHRCVAPNKDGVMNLVPRGHGGYWRMDGGGTVSNIFLGHERLQGCADLLAEGRGFELFGRVCYSDPKLYSIMSLIRDEATAPGSHGTMFLEHALDMLCIVLLRGHSTLAYPSSRRLNGLAPWQVKRVTTYMRERIGADITLQELADTVARSRFHFCTAFRAATGVAPYEYLTRMRMRTACTLLRTSPLSISDVATAVGYSSLSAFSTAFRRYAGTSPRAYRNATK